MKHAFGAHGQETPRISVTVTLPVGPRTFGQAPHAMLTVLSRLLQVMLAQATRVVHLNIPVYMSHLLC
jgi:hypothetical protein